MSLHQSSPPETGSHIPSDWERALLDRQLERLDRLADMGLTIAGAIERRVVQAEAEAEPDAALHHAAMDFARVSRAVRMTLALQSRLIQDFKAPPRSAATAAAAAASGKETLLVRWADPESSQRSKVQSAVRRVGEDAGLDRETVERMAAEAGERYEDDDIYADLTTRHIDEIVALICKDLGLTSPDRGSDQREGDHPPSSAQPREERMVEGAGGMRPPFHGSS